VNKSNLRDKRPDPSRQANALLKTAAVLAHKGEEAQSHHGRVFTQSAGRRVQSPVQAGPEASLKFQQSKGAGRPCYEAATPLAVENGVGKLAAPKGCA